MNKNILLVIAIIGILVFSAPALATNLTDDLISYYKLDEISGTNASDSHGTNHGTATNDRIFTSEVAGIINTAADFSQGEDRIENLSKPPSASSITLSFWFNTDSTAWQDIYYAGDGTTFIRAVVAPDHASVNLRFDMRDHTGTRVTCDADATIDINTTYFLTLRYNSSSDKMNIFLNSSELKECSWTGTDLSQDNMDDVWLGTSPGYNHVFSGWVDEFAMFDKALTQAEIEELYNSGDGLSYDIFAGVAADSIEITETDETPATPATYAPDNEYNFTATVCHETNISNLDTITYTFDSSDYTPTEISINTTCSEYFWNTTELSAGSYNWEWFANETGGDNHTASGTYTIDQATPSLSLSADPSWNETWPIETNVSGSGCPSQLTCNLYRDDVIVANPDVQSLAAGTYEYIFNTTGNENYTTATTSDTLTINQATNNTVTVEITPSTSVAYGTETTVTCSDEVGATLTLTRNGVTVSSPSTAVLASGTYVFNCSATGHENYTDTYETETLTVREGGVGCTNTTTFTFSTTLNITDATTIIDFQDQINLGNIRSDVQDVGISNGSVSVIDSEQYASFNTSGLVGEMVTIYWGNYVISGEHSTGTATPTPTNTISTYAEINNYLRLTFRDEITLEQRLAPNANTTLNLYCEGGQRGIVLEDGSNVTSLVVPTYQARWTKARAAVEYSPTEIYTRTILITSGISERNMWIVDAENYQMAQVVNELNDLSGKFKTGETWLEVKKWSGDELRTVYQEYFDASRYAYFFGHVGSEYQYYVHGETETRNLGWVIVDTSNLQKTITLAVVVNFDNVEYLGNVRFGTYYNETTGVVTLVYDDEYNETTEVNLSIWNTTGTRNEKDSLIYFASASNLTSDTSSVVFQYLVPNRNATYMLYGAANHLEAIGAVSFSTLFGGLATAALTGISQVYLTLSALVATFSVTFSLSWKNVAFGSVVGAVLLGMFASIGFLNIPTALVAVILMGSIVWMLGREVHKP